MTQRSGKGIVHNLTRLGTLATLGMVAFFGFAVAESTQFRGIGQWFPLLATSSGLLVALIGLGMQVAGRPFEARAAFDAAGSDEQPDGTDEPRVSGPVVLGWVIAFPIAVALVGTTIAVACWLPAFLLVVARLSWRVALPVSVAAVAVITVFRLYLDLQLPASMLVG